MPSLAELRPIVADLSLPEPLAIAPLAGGTAEVFRIDLADGSALVLKSFAAGHLAPHKDAYAAGLLAHLDIPVSRYLLIDESLSRLPFRFTLTTYLEGRIATSFANHPHYRDVFRQMGALAHQLHEIRLPAFGNIPANGGSAPHASNEAYLCERVNGAFADFLAQGGDPVMTASLRRIVEREFDAVVPYGGQAVFAHSDLQPHNVLVAERDGDLVLSGLIDYGNFRAESAVMDLAKTIFCSEHDAPGSTAAILDGYGPIDHPRPERALSFYTLLHRLTMWSWLRHIGVFSTPDAANDITPALEATAAGS